MDLKADFQTFPLFAHRLCFIESVAASVTPSILAAAARRGRGFAGEASDAVVVAPSYQEVSGTAPPSRMIRAQHSRIAVKTSSMAAPIFK